MSDKLRTSVENIISAVDSLLADDSLSGKQRQKLQAMRENAARFLEHYQQCTGKSQQDIRVALSPYVRELLAPIRADAFYWMGPWLRRFPNEGRRQHVQQIRENIQLVLAWIAGPTDLLIQQSLSAEGEDSHEAWVPIWELQQRGTHEVLEAARTLSQSDNPRERRLGISILGRLGTPERTYPDECFEALANVFEAERDEDTLEAVLNAFYHLDDLRAVKLVAPLKDHPNSDIRYAVVAALSKHEDDLAIETLIPLTADPDEEVRDWATFGLGSLIDSDTPAIRQALLRRLTDDHEETRGEAIAGLARRHDEQGIKVLIEEFRSHDAAYPLIIQAAEESGDPRLYPVLLEYRQRVSIEEDWINLMLDDAIVACKPPDNE